MDNYHQQKFYRIEKKLKQTGSTKKIQTLNKYGNAANSKQDEKNKNMHTVKSVLQWKPNKKMVTR